MQMRACKYGFPSLSAKYKLPRLAGYTYRKGSILYLRREPRLCVNILWESALCLGDRLRKITPRLSPRTFSSYLFLRQE